LSRSWKWSSGFRALTALKKALRRALQPHHRSSLHHSQRRNPRLFNLHPFQMMRSSDS